MEYRKAGSADIEILMELRAEMLRKVNDLPEDYAFSDVLIENSRRYFLGGDQTTVIALDNGEAIACASISYIEVMPTYAHPTGKRAHLMNVYTKPSYRRQGIARILVNMLIDEAKERGVTEIGLAAVGVAGRKVYLDSTVSSGRSQNGDPREALCSADPDGDPNAVCRGLCGDHSTGCSGDKDSAACNAVDVRGFFFHIRNAHRLADAAPELDK